MKRFARFGRSDSFLNFSFSLAPSFVITRAASVVTRDAFEELSSSEDMAARLRANGAYKAFAVHEPPCERRSCHALAWFLDRLFILFPSCRFFADMSRPPWRTVCQLDQSRRPNKYNQMTIT